MLAAEPSPTVTWADCPALLAFTAAPTAVARQDAVRELRFQDRFVQTRCVY